jgi:hypothetical protein
VDCSNRGLTRPACEEVIKMMANKWVDKPKVSGAADSLTGRAGRRAVWRASDVDGRCNVQVAEWGRQHKSSGRD